MSPLATLIVAWAAVYGYVCAYYCALHALRRTDREYLAFGLFAGAQSVYAVGQVAYVSAETLSESAQAMRLLSVGVVVGIPFLVDFCHALVGRRSRLVTVAYAWSILGLVAVALGLFIDASTPAPPASWGLSWAPEHVAARIRPLGLSYIGTGYVLAGISLHRLWPAARTSTHVRVVLAGLCPALLAGGHDILVRTAGLRSVFLLEHSLLLAVMAMSWVLLDRFMRSDEDLSARTRELGESYAALQATQVELVRKEQLAAVGELSAVIAHEVRNPLAIIKNAASGLRRRSLEATDAATLLDILDEETDRLNRLMHDLLSYARPVLPEGAEVEVEGLVRAALDLAGAGAAHRPSLEIVIDLDGCPPTLYGDADLLRHALVNIADNAMQAMASGGCLRVSGRPDEIGGQAAVALTFEDDGEGMDTLVREKARSPFFTTRPSGTGLGLAIVERVVGNHGGTVSIESRYGVGTTVTVRLPCQRLSLFPVPAYDPATAGPVQLRGGA